MNDLEERLNTLLGNPQLMQQIASMAQAMGQNSQEARSEPSEPPQQLLDPKLLDGIARTLSQSGIDSNQERLLQALRPFLSARRIQKLQRAMEAARLAGTASAFLRAGGLQTHSGRESHV